MIIDPQNSDIHRLRFTQRSPRWRLTVENGVHWLLAPNGEKLYGSGVNGVDAGSPPEEVEGRPAYYLWNLYDSVDQWAHTVRDRLDRWGVYTYSSLFFFFFVSKPLLFFSVFVLSFC